MVMARISSIIRLQLLAALCEESRVLSTEVSSVRGECAPLFLWYTSPFSILSAGDKNMNRSHLLQPVNIVSREKYTKSDIVMFSAEFIFLGHIVMVAILRVFSIIK